MEMNLYDFTLEFIEDIRRDIDDLAVKKRKHPSVDQMYFISLVSFLLRNEDMADVYMFGFLTHFVEFLEIIYCDSCLSDETRDKIFEFRVNLYSYGFLENDTVKVMTSNGEFVVNYRLN